IWGYQDIGARILTVPLLGEEAWSLPKAKLQSLLDGRYEVDLSPLVEVCDALKKRVEEDDEDPEWFPRFTKEDYTPFAEEVHQAVLAHHPDWFGIHQRALEGVWEGMFRMEFNEESFTTRWQTAIGYLGRNCRMRDDMGFFPLLHFLRRYVTLETLRTELRLLHRTRWEIAGGLQRVIFVDTSGVEGRRTHPQSSEHPRYHTRGVADLRAIGEGLVPLYSMPCPSTDTEAMHAVELVARAIEVAGDGIRLYGGNGHTVSRVSTALLFGTFDVVSAGHVVHPPKGLSPSRMEKLQRHLGLLNKVFTLMRQHPELGCTFSSRSHVYVDGMNVRALMENLGCLILKIVLGTGYDGRAFQPYIESAMRMKRQVRIFERGVLRVEPDRQALSLLASEVVLVMVGVWKVLRRKGLTEPVGAIDLEDLALFRPT
ncbi:MAG: hypothetical protein JRN35_09660, partial [Nitrososphaerota archaeon]|nr:hypothetical protein [Nitrososphaerota archaeon]